jgi:hypothetical protein
LVYQKGTAVRYLRWAFPFKDDAISKTGLAVVAILASGLGLLVSEPKADAASFGSVTSIHPTNASDGALQRVHYSNRYGWHCGMWEYYGHSHREHWQEDMEVGEGIMVAAAIATMIVIMIGIGIMIEIMIEITTKIMTATTNGITTAIETPSPSKFATRPQEDPTWGRFHAFSPARAASASVAKGPSGFSSL